MKIYKCKLPVEPGEHRMMCFPIETLLRVDTVNNEPYFWAVVNNDRRLTEHRVLVYFTGDTDNSFGHHECLGTAILHDGSYVLHYYIDAL